MQRLKSDIVCVARGRASLQALSWVKTGSMTMIGQTANKHRLKRLLLVPVSCWVNLTSDVWDL